ncbi:glycerol kinase GlpK [Anaerocolumna sp. AGMB13020]|uniref:glycerol kinase GlpK n=1 Tax=Anaerocolumna sp. AGMB13020 TaxID=3081750 RepID=UPI0029542B9D|nr:glycerol kinase GlpK [Anaerocolumna sp. AGMB13020]WOO34510.1 glycerol kinase GlpK [Anaerocolumna sp. AGMB13020]
MKNYIMALDQGTTSSRCILFNRQGQAVSKAQKEFKQIYPVAGWVEQDPKEIWSSQISVAAEAMAKLGISAEDIASIGITNQRETTILWNKLTGEPVYNAIVWQCRRTSDMIQTIKASGLDRVIKEHTGLIPDAYFSATKIKWIFDNVEGVKEEAEKGNLLFGTVDTWLIWKLTGGKVFATDYTNASRTMLFDIKKLKWDDEILNALDIPKSILPEVKPSSHIFGLTEKGLLGGKITIGGVAGDQQAALFGQGCYEKGEVKNTYGTGCFLLMNTGDTPITSNNGLLTTIAASEKGKVQYALEGSVFVAGAAIQWLRDELQIIRDAAETEEAALSVKDTNGVYVVPAFSGLGAPYWDQYARGTIVGMTRGFNKNHLIRATLESIAYQNYAVLKAMEQDAGVEIKRLKADGGASSNNFLMKFQADILGIEVIRPSCVETTALGAAYLAGLAAGFWKDREEIKSNGRVPEIFNPDMEETIREKKLQGWNKAVKRSFEWEKEIE